MVGPDGTVTFVELPQGAPLGAGGPPFESVELSLAQGSTLALHTDGVPAHGEEWALDAGRERLRRALERSADALDCAAGPSSTRWSRPARTTPWRC